MRADRSGLRTRLAMLVACTLLVTLVLTSGLLVRAMDATYREEARHRAAALLGSLAVPCAMSLSVHALEQVDGYLAEVVRAGGGPLELLHVVMLDSQGRVVAHAARRTVLPTAEDASLDAQFLQESAKSLDARWREATDRDGHPLLLASMPAVSGLRWGTLVAAFDLRPVEERVAWTRWILLAVAVSLAAALGAVTWWGLARLVVGPVRRLAQAAAALEAGDLTARAGTGHEEDELGRLAATFDRMADRIQRHTEGLERKVQERSAEITRKNNDLLALNEQLQAAVSELDRMARTDALTGVQNRRSFVEAMAGRLRKDKPTSLLMIDVDRFKQLNDRWGHPVGDVVLREVARVLSTGLRHGDILARYGGEEFAVILDDTPPEPAMEVAQRLREAVAGHDFAAATGTGMGPVTVSLGVASYPNDADDPQALITRADRALYEAKGAGRNCVRAWQPALTGGEGKAMLAAPVETESAA